MSRRTSGMSLGAALLLALGAAAVPATAAPHRPPPVERVSTAADGSQADGPSGGAAISADGRHVAFTSTAPSLGCAQYFTCLRLKDLTTGKVTAVDLGSGYAYGSPMPSADGSRVAFSAGVRFQAPYLYDRATGVSTKLWPENPPGFDELGGVESISPDGTHVAYTIGNRNGPQATRLLYVRDTATGTDELISPAEEGDKAGASVSGDGERVAYGVRTGSGTDPADVFVKDRRTGERTQVDTGLGAAYLVRITADGRRVLLDAEGGLYVHDLRTGESRRVADGRPLSATADGRYAVVAGADGTRVRDLRTGRKGAALPTDAQVGPDTLTAGGRAVAFSSASSLVPDDTNGVADVFVRQVS
ncbi:TolB family protein [Streptomyces sp. NPDC088350]|uniref:TolB family protein n=1 Tax=Streptomyces sp. NPDC088350 TaxID=3365854 RepID=UPI003811230A